MTVLNVLAILAALIGGVGAVIIGQILSLYRDDIDSARYARYQFSYVLLLNRKSFSVSEVERISSKMKDSIEDVAREDLWLFSDQGKLIMVQLVHELYKLEYAASEGDLEEADAHLDAIRKNCER